VSLSKILSLLVAGVYLLIPIVMYICGNQEAFEGIVMVLIYLVLPMACIWYGDELGGLTGIKYGLVSSTSPGWGVEVIGWLLLLLPLIVGIIFSFIE
jgi:hypothetical protein